MHRLFSFILSAVYRVKSLNCLAVRTFFARANISRHISLNTRSAHLDLESSISSLQAIYRVSFMFLTPSFLILFVAFLQWSAMLIVCDLQI